MNDPIAPGIHGAGPRRTVCVGECMVELARAADGRFDLSVGGDTFNTAVYLARAGVPTAYATALGDDPYSDAIIERARSEGVQADAILRVPGRVPGLYLIETDAAGERRFFYWRDTAPVRELFRSLDDGPAFSAVAGAGLVYFSGITLWVLSRGSLERFFAALDDARARGARIAFDGNFRPRLWGEGLALARDIFAAALRRADVALPTFDDERLLWGDRSAEETIDRLRAAGVTEIVVKDGHGGAVVAAAAGGATRVPVPEPVKAVDTTAAGDSFNAGYLAARLSGRTPEAAARLGHRLAGVVISHRGAIVPAAATAAVTLELAQP